MAKGKPTTDLCGDINKLVQPQRGNQVLTPRESRTPIEQQKGSGKSAESASGESEQLPVSDVSGSIESADGLFYIVYDYHHHNA